MLSGDVRVNNVSTGSMMTDIEARIFSVNPPDVGIGWNDHEWNYKSAAEGLSSRFVNWAFSGSGGADFEFVVEVSWTPVPAKIAWVSERDGNQEVYVANRGWHGSHECLGPRRRRRVPSLSADGSSVAWRSNRDGNWEVWVANDGRHGACESRDGDFLAWRRWEQDRLVRQQPRHRVGREHERHGGVEVGAWPRALAQRRWEQRRLDEQPLRRPGSMRRERGRLGGRERVPNEGGADDWAPRSAPMGAASPG